MKAREYRLLRSPWGIVNSLQSFTSPAKVIKTTLADWEHLRMSAPISENARGTVFVYPDSAIYIDRYHLVVYGHPDEVVCANIGPTLNHLPEREYTI